MKSTKTIRLRFCRHAKKRIFRVLYTGMGNADAVNPDANATVLVEFIGYDYLVTGINVF